MGFSVVYGGSVPFLSSGAFYFSWTRWHTRSCTCYSRGSSFCSIFVATGSGVGFVRVGGSSDSCDFAVLGFDVLGAYSACFVADHVSYGPAIYVASTCSATGSGRS